MAGHNILVIDGDVASRNYLATHLRKDGDTVLLAPTGRRGLVLAWQNTPDLIIADPMLSDLPGEELAARLRRDARTARVPLVAFSHTARTARLRSWLESGFDDYLVKSPQVMPLLKASIADLLGSGSQLERTGGVVIAFFSAKGGVGTSSLCVNLATCIADGNSTSRVVVADLVLPMGSLSELVGYPGKHNLGSLWQKPDHPVTTDWLRRSLPRLDQWNFSLLGGSSDPDDALRLDSVKIMRAVSALKSSFDIVLLDLGRSLSRISLPLLDGADLIVITASADRDSVRLTKAAWEYLNARGLQESGIYLLFNRPVLTEGLSKTAAEEFIGLPVRAAFPHLGENLSLTNNQHVPFIRHFPANAAAHSFRRTAQEVVAAAKQRRGI